MDGTLEGTLGQSGTNYWVMIMKCVLDISQISRTEASQPDVI